MQRINRRVLGLAAAVFGLLVAGFVWFRTDQPITTARTVHAAVPRLFGGDYGKLYKNIDAGVVCGVYRRKDIHGKFQAPSPFIVWFQTRDWYSWRDPVLLEPTAEAPAFIFKSTPQGEADQMTRELAGLDEERRTNDYYRFVAACDQASGS